MWDDCGRGHIDEDQILCELSPVNQFIKWLSVFLWCAVIFYFSHRPVPPPMSESQTFYGIDIIYHLICYGLLGILCFRAKASLLFACGFSSLYGLSDEFHQYLMPFREFQIHDLIADGLGSYIGILSYMKVSKLQPGDKIKQLTIGYSVSGESMDAIQIGDEGEVIHFYGGVHGDEPEGVDLAFKLKDYLVANAKDFKNKTLIVVPIVNPDGFKNKTRVNLNKVDLNRNFPSKDWVSKCDQPRYYPGPTANSEPETKAIVELIEQTQPKKIITFHSLIPHQINYDGPAKKLAYAMSSHNQYPVTEHIGYATPGSLGSFAGGDKNVSVITYELPEKISPDNAWNEAVKAILEAIRFSEL